jgi:hypothetical protein
MIFSENRRPPIGSKPEGKLFRIMLYCLSTTSFSKGMSRAANSCCSFLGYFELVENLAEDFQRPVPIGFGDAGTGVRGFHVAAGIDARAAARLANKVDQQLPDAELAVGGEADEETLLLLVRSSAAQ